MELFSVYQSYLHEVLQAIDSQEIIYYDVQGFEQYPSSRSYHLERKEFLKVSLGATLGNTIRCKHYRQASGLQVEVEG